jgi:hypothetical protein
VRRQRASFYLNGEASQGPKGSHPRK